MALVEKKISVPFHPTLRDRPTDRRAMFVMHERREGGIIETCTGLPRSGRQQVHRAMSASVRVLRKRRARPHSVRRALCELTALLRSTALLAAVIEAASEIDLEYLLPQVLARLVQARGDAWRVAVGAVVACVEIGGTSPPAAVALSAVKHHVAQTMPTVPDDTPLACLLLCVDSYPCAHHAALLDLLACVPRDTALHVALFALAAPLPLFRRHATDVYQSAFIVLPHRHAMRARFLVRERALSHQYVL